MVGFVGFVFFLFVPGLRRVLGGVQLVAQTCVLFLSGSSRFSYFGLIA